MLSYAAIHYDFDNEFEKFEFPNEIEMRKEMMDRNIGYDFKEQKHMYKNLFIEKGIPKDTDIQIKFF